jgi:hypothetical protein
MKEDRDAQKSQAQQRREQEIHQKLLEDRQLVAIAQWELEEEKKRANDKKCREREMCRQVAGQANSRGSAEDAKAIRIAEEQAVVRDLELKMDTLEARKALQMRKLCGRMPPEEQRKALFQDMARKAQRRKEEDMQDQRFMQRQHEVNKQQWIAEQEKLDAKRKQLHCHKEFLFEQMQKRQAEKRERDDERNSNKAALELASKEHFELERQQAEMQRQKMLRHRQELEEQIAARKHNPTVSKAAADHMTKAEQAINKTVLAEAIDLRRRVPL